MHLIVTKTIQEEYHIPNGNSFYELMNSLQKDKMLYKEFEMCKVSTRDNDSNSIKIELFETEYDEKPGWVSE